VVGLVAAIIEVSSPHFGSGFVAAGALAAAAAAYVFDYGVAAQIALFAVVMSVSLFALRSWLIRGLFGGPGVPSRTDTMVGRDGIVTHDIDTTVGGGRVNVGGEDWAARSREVIAAGTKVKVVGADGIVLEVTRA